MVCSKDATSLVTSAGCSLTVYRLNGWLDLMDQQLLATIDDQMNAAHHFIIPAHVQFVMVLIAERSQLPG